MKKHLERKVKAGKSKPKLKDIDSDILPAAWSILRWLALFPSCRPHPAYYILIGVSPPVRPTLKP
jgi:ubiquitin-conjugating enzyme E2 Q